MLSLFEVRSIQAAKSKSSSCPSKMFLMRCGSVAGVKVWKARTGFRLIKCLASIGMWLCTHKAKGPAQWTLHWFGSLVNSNIP